MSGGKPPRRVLVTGSAVGLGLALARAFAATGDTVFLTDISPEVAHAAKAPSELCLMHLYPIDGAVHRAAKDATAWNVRAARFSMVIAGIHSDPAQASALKQWGRQYWQAVHPFNMDGGYVNFLMDDEVDGRVQASYGDNYARLATVKAKYDPGNLFRVNQNITPAVGAG